MDSSDLQKTLGLKLFQRPETSEALLHCGKIWDPAEARFTQCIVPWAALFPAIVILSLYVGRILQPVLRSLQPQWTKKFVSEKRDAPPESGRILDRRTPWSAHFLSAFGIVATVTQTLATVLTSRPEWPYVVLLCSWFAITIWIIVERPKNAYLSLLAAYIVLLAAHAVILSLKRTSQLHIISGSISVAVVSLCTFTVLIMPLRDPTLPTSDIGSQDHDASFHQRSPEDNLSLLQFLTVSWMAPIIKQGNLKQLDNEDVWVLPWDFQHTRLHQRFRELKGSVTARLLQANGIDLVLNTFFGSVEMVCNLAAPVLLQQLLRAMEDDEIPMRASITYAALILAVRMVAAQASIMNLWFSRRCYERSRGEMITMLYEKTLNRKIVGLKQEDGTPGLDENVEASRKPNFSQQSWFRRAWNKITRREDTKAKADLDQPSMPASTGKILNLMRNDVYEVAQRFWEFPNVFTKPLGLVLSVVLVWKFIGWPCLLGVATVLVAQLLNAFLARQLIKVERLRRSATDKKLQMTSQFVEAVRHLRWYGWTGSWLSKIMDSRQVELNLRVLTSLCGLGIGFINVYSAELFPVVAFFAYTYLAGEKLRIDIAFPALQLFTMLQDNLRQVPELILVLLNAYIAIGRIEEFMQEPNKEEHNQSLVLHVQPEMLKASFAWPGQTEPVLHDISITIPEGLTLVYGKVAAGKSALLQAFLGELDTLHGDLTQHGNVVGYCAQTPWLQSMSIRDNILFGSPYDRDRYHQVLEACQLTADFAEFKAGDLSNIGENGIGLSGGQKARTALARAIYSKASTLYLDDPISALDHDTAERVTKACFSGPLMRGRTVVLVTHRLELCQRYAKQIVEIVDGRARVLDSAELDNIAPLELEHVEASTTDDPTEAQQKAAVPDKFIEDEGRAKGGVKFSVYWEYVKAGKLRWWGAMIFTMALGRLSSITESWFLKKWGEAYDNPQEQDWSGLQVRGVFDDMPSPEHNIKPWLIGFFLIGTAQALGFLFAMSFVILIVYVSGRRMFKRIMDRVSHATFRFYDTTPVGRLMNRLTSDISTIDGNISHQLGIVAFLAISWVLSIIFIGSVKPIFLLFGTFLTAGFVFVFVQFLPTSQSLRRLEMVSLSPLMSNFGALLEGLTTVRAFKAQTRFQEQVIEVVDTFQKMDHFYWSLQAWLQYRFDALSASSTLILTLLALFTGVSPGLTAFVLVTAERFVGATHQLCKQYGQLQLEFVSVERVVELLHLDQEPPGTIAPPAAWPSFAGDIVFENVTIRYAPHLEPALSDVSLTIKAGTSTAVLGRTGSGKSTLALALLATMAPTSGRILIDGIDIAEVDKQALRSRVTFLAQDPVLFPGTLRHNLDPIEEHSDEACADVLQRVAASHDWKLDMEIDTAGKNLSQGQRQLVGLARVILRRSAIVILDEATASIDTGTAMHVQEVLRQEMKESTVITVAHRLEAVKDADYCVVLAKGKVIEAGNAKDMLKGRK